MGRESKREKELSQVALLVGFLQFACPKNMVAISNTIWKKSLMWINYTILTVLSVSNRESYNCKLNNKLMSWHFLDVQVTRLPSGIFTLVGIQHFQALAFQQLQLVVLSQRTQLLQYGIIGIS